MNRRTYRYICSLSGFLVSLLVVFDVGPLAAQEQLPPDDKRLRVIVTSDFPPFPVMNSDPDDVQSMVRFLLYSNEFDVEGLIASAGTYGMVAEKKNILAVLDEYDNVDENLRKHDPRYPTADALRAVTYEGKGNNNGINIKWGCGKQPVTDIIGAGKDSEASNAIIAAADKPDRRPIYIGVWGGPREVAQAIWDVKNTRSEAETKAFIGKLRVFLIACQDASHEWLMKEFPDLYIIESKKTYQGMFKVDSQEWAEENIIKNHGPLCAIYPPKAIAGPGVIEGDSAPNPVSQMDFMRTLRHVIPMPIGLPAFEWMVRLGAPLVFRTDPELALYGRYVVSKRLNTMCEPLGVNLLGQPHLIVAQPIQVRAWLASRCS